MNIWSKHKKDRKTRLCDDDSDEIKTIIERSLSHPQQQSTNIIYFWELITIESSVKLIKQIDEVNRNIRFIQLNYGMDFPPPIHLHVHSSGGDPLSALALSDKINTNPIPIWTYCEGEVASAATLLTIVGQKRFINRNSCILIHQLSSEMWGTYQEIKEEVQNLELLMEFLRNIYTKHTNLEPNLIEDILKHDLYMKAEMALEKGLVDEII